MNGATKSPICNQMRKKALHPKNRQRILPRGCLRQARLYLQRRYRMVSNIPLCPIIWVPPYKCTMNWETKLGTAPWIFYGKVTNFEGSSLNECPFRYQGQYADEETELYYNRFRYYSPQKGGYISKDPIGLNGGEKLYNYVYDPNSWIDEYGLVRNGHLAGNKHPITGVPFDSNGFPDFPTIFTVKGKMML